MPATEKKHIRHEGHTASFLLLFIDLVTMNADDDDDDGGIVLRTFKRKPHPDLPLPPTPCVSTRTRFTRRIPGCECRRIQANHTSGGREKGGRGSMSFRGGGCFTHQQQQRLLGYYL